MALTPVEFSLSSGETIAGVEDVTPSCRFTMLFLHDAGGDLDSIVPLLAQVGIEEARKIAIDLPGHGLSSGAFDPAAAGQALLELRDVLRARNGERFLFVAAGSTAAHALRLAEGADTVGLCLISPRSGTVALTGVPRCPVLAFVSGIDDAATVNWMAVRSTLRSRWMTASMAASHSALISSDESVRGQIASHLQGFAREMFVMGRPPAAPTA